ncbi:MAG: sugar nucleotide-binding protein [Gemmataceae bacterium]|nr:sugar nucleotide-binding protein [Gemmataceae bacterium]
MTQTGSPCFPCRLPPERLPVLITGVTGVAGFNALHYFQARYPGQVVGIRPLQTWRLVGDGIVAIAIEDVAGLHALFDRHAFRSVLNCVGNCALKSCELNPAMARHLNVQSARVILDCTVRRGVRLVHLSSDLVFGGTRGGGHVETDAIDPVTIYGKTMAEAEELLLAADPDAAILRISLPMGPSFNRHAGAIDWIDSRFRHGRPATLYFDEVRSCTYTDDLNRVFERFLAGDESGIYHLGAPRALTLYQIAQVINRVGGYDPALLHGCPRQAAGPMPPRAGDVSMCSDKLLSILGRQAFQPWPAGADVFPSDRRWHFERPADETGGVQRIVERLYRYPAEVHSGNGRCS